MSDEKTAELVTIEQDTPQHKKALTIHQDPAESIAQASEAAKMLQQVIRQSKVRKTLIIQGKEYLYFEDWQTIARFYGVSAKAVSAEPIDMGEVKGFKAKAVAVNVETGVEISGAAAYCFNDEKNWKNKPIFQLASMAQTRACSKALRNVFASVVVLAGFCPTPAEEMDNIAPNKDNEPPKITREDQSNIHNLLKDKAEIEGKDLGKLQAEFKTFLIKEFGSDKTMSITKERLPEVWKWIGKEPQEEKII